jgi:hypothetical protein
LSGYWSHQKRARGRGAREGFRAIAAGAELDYKAVPDMHALVSRVFFSQAHPAARCRRVRLAELPDDTRRAMVQLAARSCAHLDGEAYVGERLRKYESVALWSGRRGGLAAFILFDEFSEGNDHFVYLGPLFSLGGACVQLVVGLIGAILRERPRAAVHFAAELQSAEALLIFKRLFLRTSFPPVSGEAAPPRVRRILACYQRRLPHIGPIDMENLSTRSRQTLFRPRPELEPVVQLLASRGVDLARGDSQILVLSCEPSVRERFRVWRDMRDGTRALADWKATRRQLLARIGERSI